MANEQRMEKTAHQKHGATVKPSLGQYGRNEWAILGAPCHTIQRLAGELCAQLSPKWQLAYADADHKSEKEGLTLPVQTGHALSPHIASIEPTHALSPHIAYTDKTHSHRIDFAAPPNSFRFRHWFHEMDAVLINGNHFNGQQQIVIIDPAKKESLERKLDRLTNVQLILLQEGQTEPWPFLVKHLAGKTVPVLPLANADAVAQWLNEQLQAAVPPLRGLVLAGGYSKRMGRDKGLINYHGKPQREYMADLLAPLCTEVFISCRADQAGDIPLPYHALPDTFLDLGPFGAILSAFRAYPDSAWLITACDLPLLDAATLGYLAGHRSPSHIATAFYDPANTFPEPLISIWEPKAYPTLLQFLSQGHSCPRKVLINSRVHLLTAPDVKALTNVNTPQEAEGVKGERLKDKG